MQELSIVSNLILEKEKASMFDNPTLLNILRENKISQIEVIGIDGNCCVASSAIDASNLGFSVIFPLGYIDIKNKQRFLKTKEKLIKAKVKIVD